MADLSSIIPPSGVLTPNSSLNAGNLTGALPAISGAALTGIQSSPPVGTSYSSPSRSGYNTAYQNTSSNVRIVYIGGHGSIDYVYISPDNSNWYTVYNYAGGTGSYEYNSTTLVVPPNHYYRYSGPYYDYWVEVT